MHNRFLYALSLFLFINPVLNAEQEIFVENAWIREAPPTIRIHAAYLTLKNNTSENINLIKITSENFERIEIHNSVIENDIAKMIKLETIDIPAQSEFVFSPGGHHLMLFNSKNLLKQGDNESIKLIFADGKTIPATLVVKPADLSIQHDHHH